jgi:hypothetical protein
MHDSRCDTRRQHAGQTGTVDKGTTFHAVLLLNAMKGKAALRWQKF